jgi:hypothetical protein
MPIEKLQAWYAFLQTIAIMSQQHGGFDLFWWLRGMLGSNG